MPTSAPIRATPAARAETLRLVRRLHLYFGLFIAPALLFFAFTGAVQTLSLHESAGTSYTPPVWLARLGQLHKNQTLAQNRKAPRPDPTSPNRPHVVSSQPTATAPPPSPPTLGSKQRRHLPEKIFFLAVSLGLFTSTLTGIYMAFRYERNRVLIAGLLLAGIVIPLLLLPF